MSNDVQHDQPASPSVAATLEVGDGKKIVAYSINPNMNMELVPASQERTWMDATRMRFAYRCLPLLIANQHGWWILNNHKFKAMWDGTDGPESIRIKYAKGAKEPFSALSHFGHGVLTFSLPYLFRTPPGYNMVVRGPSNMPKDGIAALDGIVETDWNVATFTMNWLFTRSHYPVIFEAAEPICMIYPVKRGEVEQFDGEIRPIADAPDVEEAYTNWSQSRNRFNEQLHVPDSEEGRQGWQKEYFQGAMGSAKNESHQTRLNVRKFQQK